MGGLWKRSSSSQCSFARQRLQSIAATKQASRAKAKPDEQEQSRFELYADAVKRIEQLHGVSVPAGEVPGYCGAPTAQVSSRLELQIVGLTSLNLESYTGGLPPARTEKPPRQQKVSWPKSTLSLNLSHRNQQQLRCRPRAVGQMWFLKAQSHHRPFSNRCRQISTRKMLPRLLLPCCRRLCQLQLQPSPRQKARLASPMFFGTSPRRPLRSRLTQPQRRKLLLRRKLVCQQVKGQRSRQCNTQPRPSQEPRFSLGLPIGNLDTGSGLISPCGPRKLSRPNAACLPSSNRHTSSEHLQSTPPLR